MTLTGEQDQLESQDITLTQVCNRLFPVNLPHPPPLNIVTVLCVMELQELGHALRKTTLSPPEAARFQGIAQLETPVDCGLMGNDC